MGLGFMIKGPPAILIPGLTVLGYLVITKQKTSFKDLCFIQGLIILLIIIAQCKYLIHSLHRKPIVLLDEVCSHLDKYNREILLELINSLDVQIFITGSEKNFFSFLSTKASYYYIN